MEIKSGLFWAVRAAEKKLPTVTICNFFSSSFFMFSRRKIILKFFQKCANFHTEKLHNIKLRKILKNLEKNNYEFKIGYRLILK